jgi:hypothetical protein
MSSSICFRFIDWRGISAYKRYRRKLSRAQRQFEGRDGDDVAKASGFRPFGAVRSKESTKLQARGTKKC